MSSGLLLHRGELIKYMKVSIIQLHNHACTNLICKKILTHIHHLRLMFWGDTREVQMHHAHTPVHPLCLLSLYQGLIDPKESITPYLHVAVCNLMYTL